MRVHLTKYDVIALWQQVAESAELGDDGEFFAEEALGCFSDAEIDAIEDLYGGSAEDLLMEVYATWEGAEPEAILETLSAAFSELDIEVTYDEVDEDDEDDFVSDGDWSDPADDEEEEAY